MLKREKKKAFSPFPYLGQKGTFRVFGEIDGIWRVCVAVFVFSSSSAWYSQTRLNENSWRGNRQTHIGFSLIPINFFFKKTLFLHFFTYPGLTVVE